MKVDVVIFAFLTLAICIIPLNALKYTQRTAAIKNASIPQPAGSQATAATASSQSSQPASINDKIKEALTKQQSSKAESIEYFKILNLSTGKVEKVNVPDYVRGVVAAEMPPSFQPEALKAQAVASHSYALRQAQQQRTNPDKALKGADFSADPQNWIGYVTEKQAKERFGEKFDIYWNAIKQAADSVNNYIITYQNEPILAAYHAISTGNTEASENVWQQSVPYLISVESDGDLLAPDYETATTMTVQEVKAALTKNYPDIKLPADSTKWFTDIERSQPGYIVSVKAGNFTLHGKDIRRIFNLRSSNIEIKSDGVKFTFTVYGYGHGVGMSQYGADYMARQGATFEEILLHYYPDTIIKQIA